MADTTKKKVRNVSVRVPDELYRDVKRTFADTDETFQSLIVALLIEYVRRGHGPEASRGLIVQNFNPNPAPKRRAGGK
jgi:hypothetical protein